MNPKHVHTPVSTRVRCPVCHEAVYSRAGIHPQCAVRQSEPPRPKAKPPGSSDVVAESAAGTGVMDSLGAGLESPSATD